MRPHIKELQKQINIEEEINPYMGEYAEIIGLDPLSAAAIKSAEAVHRLAERLSAHQNKFINRT